MKTKLEIPASTVRRIIAADIERRLGLKPGQVDRKGITYKFFFHNPGDEHLERREAKYVEVYWEGEI